MERKALTLDGYHVDLLSFSRCAETDAPRNLLPANTGTAPLAMRAQASARAQGRWLSRYQRHPGALRRASIKRHRPLATGCGRRTGDETVGEIRRTSAEGA